VKNLKGNESVEKIIDLLNNKSQVTSVEEFKNKREAFESSILQKFNNECCDGFVALGDYNFPKHNSNIKDSEQPVFIFYKGNIDLLNSHNKNISVIGLLNPESDIEERERKLVAEFVKYGATIVSGLAFGCDSISHNQALDSKGKTVAILPSPLNNILPARNKGLAYKIVEEGGLLITEYGNDFKTTMELNSRYKERDRLQALFCDTIVLAASYTQESVRYWKHLSGQKLDSGARLAMEYAKVYNTPRAVMYDKYYDENNPMFDLNRQLIDTEVNITSINQENLVETVQKIMSKKRTVQHISWHEQGRLNL
jgi:DNA processing protein